MRQPWDQGAMYSGDKKNPHGGASALIYSCDRLRPVQRVGSGMALISPVFGEKKLGLDAASGCKEPQAGVIPAPAIPAMRCRWELWTLGARCLVSSGDL